MRGFTSTLVAGFVIGAGIAGFLEAPWITVPILAFIIFAISNIESFVTKPLGPVYSVSGIVGGLAFSYLLACLWIGAAFGVGRLISSIA
jgi:hypothetical protein